MVTLKKSSQETAVEQQGRKLDEAEKANFVNLTIKVRKIQRLHWLIEAKKQGTSLTAAITDALNERFGTPE